MKNMINFKNWLVSEEIEVINTPTGDYCSGVSMNMMTIQLKLTKTYHTTSL